MTITHPYPEGEVVVYTDGLCFVDIKNKNNLPGIKILHNDDNNCNRTAMFNISEGWWWIPPTYRMTVYNYKEINSNKFLDINTRIIIKPGNFVYLEEETRRPPLMAGMQEEIYYDITFHNEESLIECLKLDLDIIDTGNMVFWKNKIEVIDYIYG